MGVIVAEVEMDGATLTVERFAPSKYNVIHCGVIRHPGLNADEVIGVMAHYIHGLSYRLEKTKAQLKNEE